MNTRLESAVRHLNGWKIVTEGAEEAEKEEQKKRKRAEQTYEVEFITQKRILDGEIEYRVHWKNYSARQRTWEKESELSHCRRAIAAFEQNFKTAKH